MDPDRQAAKLALRLQKLIEANQKLAQVESVENLVPLLLNLAREVTGAEASSFLIHDPDHHVLRFSAIRDENINGISEKSLKQTIAIPIGEGIAGWIAREKQPLLIEDAQKDSRFFNKVDKSTGFVTRSILGVPVLYGDELLGVIEVLNARGKPCFDKADQDILMSFGNLAAVAIIRSRLLEERLQQQKINIELDTAARIQALFRPQLPSLDHGSHIWAFSKPARFVGGDLYDIIPMPDNSWLVYVADVAGKGLPAAIIMAALWYRIRSEAHLYSDVGKLLYALNAALYDLLAEEGYFVTILIGQYWPAIGKLELANGGHLPALKASKTGYESISGHRGLSLGIDVSKCYKIATVSLSDNESIFLMTDGATEAEDHKGDFFGEQRIIKCIREASGPPWAGCILKEIKAWQAHTEFSDDLTLLEIWRE